MTKTTKVDKTHDLLLHIKKPLTPDREITILKRIKRQVAFTKVCFVNLFRTVCNCGSCTGQVADFTQKIADLCIPFKSFPN